MANALLTIAFDVLLVSSVVLTSLYMVLEQFQGRAPSWRSWRARVRRRTVPGVPAGARREVPLG